MGCDQKGGYRGFRFPGWSSSGHANGWQWETRLEVTSKAERLGCRLIIPVDPAETQDDTGLGVPGSRRQKKS